MISLPIVLWLNASFSIAGCCNDPYGCARRHFYFIHLRYILNQLPGMKVTSGFN